MIKFRDDFEREVWSRAVGGSLSMSKSTILAFSNADMAVEEYRRRQLPSSKDPSHYALKCAWSACNNDISRFCPDCQWRFSL